MIHNIRSALDHLANALVVANGGIPKEGWGGTQFPITIGSDKAKIVARSGPGVSAKAQQILTNVQPRDRTDPLAILQHLSNVDKHRTLNVIVVDLRDMDVFDVPERLRDRVEWGNPPFAHGDLIYSIIPRPDEELGEMWHGFEFSPALAFGDIPGGRAEVVSTLRRVVNHVRDNVVQRFARHCLGGRLDLVE